jgi:hypothetical protein
MRFNYRQILAKLFYPGKIFVALFAGAGIIFMFTSVCFAPTKPTKMSDTDLSEVQGQASFFRITQFTSATLTPWSNTGSTNVIRLELGLTNLMNAHMRSFKMGYWNNGVTGWDQDTTNYFWGGFDHSSSPMTWAGIYVDLGFDSFGSNTARTLNYIEIGTMNASGRITGALNTINSMVSTNGTGQNAGVLLRQTGSGFRTCHFNNEIMAFIFATKYRYQSGGGGSNNATTLQGVFIKIPSFNSSAPPN